MPEQRYVSDELSHFVGKGKTAEEQYELLLKILGKGWLTHPPHNPNISGNIRVNPDAKMSTNEMYVPEVVCFCDIPPADIGLHVAKYGPFGLSFPKKFVAALGGAPVFYVPVDGLVAITKPIEEIVKQSRENPTTTGFREFHEYVERRAYLDRMFGEFHKVMTTARAAVDDHMRRRKGGVSEEWIRLNNVESFLDFHLFAYIKAFEHLLRDDSTKNYYLEREWRVVGNMKFSLTDVVRIFLPRTFAARFRENVPGYHGQLTFVD